MSGWDAIVENRIREAYEAGEFDDLPGFGRPIEGLDDRDPNWWIKRKLKAENLSVLPAVLDARLARERTLEALAALPTESAVRQRLLRLNEQIRRALHAPQDVPPGDLALVDIEAALADWRRSRR